VDAALARHGGLLLRGFGIAHADALEALARAACAELMDYRDRASPRTRVSGAVLTSTDAPAHLAIPLHNESAFTARFPQRILFACARAPREGGATLLADVRRVYEGLDPRVRQRFERTGVLYERTFGAGPGMGWREVFQVEERAELEAWAEAHAVEVEWLPGGRLRTRQIRPAVLVHPESGEALWMNHALALSARSLDAGLLETLLFQAGEPPHDATYGDGTPLAEADFAALRAAYDAELRAHAWEVGDALVLDNRILAHGRAPFRGEREILVAMGDPAPWSAAIETRPPWASLRLPERSRAEPAASGSVHAADAGELERVILAALAELLRRESVPAGADFFDLGGDSVLAARVVARVRQRLGFELPLAAFFETATIAELVGVARELAGRAAEGRHPPR